MVPDFLTGRNFYRILGILMFVGSSLHIVITAYIRKKKLHELHPDLDVMIDISKAEMAKKNGYPITVEIAGMKFPIIIHSFIRSFKIEKGKHFRLGRTLARFTVEQSTNVVRYKNGIFGRGMVVDVQNKKIRLGEKKFSITEFEIKDEQNNSIIQFLNEKQYPHQIIGKIIDEGNPYLTDLTIAYILYQLRTDLMNTNLLVKEPSAAGQWAIGIILLVFFLAIMFWVYVIKSVNPLELFGPDPYDNPNLSHPTIKKVID